MTNTTNYGLRKPEKQDPVDIADLNYNADAIDAAMHENRTTRADLKLSNLDTAQEALANLGAEVRRNLLCNGCFTGGGSQKGEGALPINQRGAVLYTGGYTMDGWKLSGGTLAIKEDCVEVEAPAEALVTLECAVEAPAQYSGRTLTLSALAERVSGTEYCYITNIFDTYKKDAAIPDEKGVCALTDTAGTLTAALKFVFVCGKGCKIRLYAAKLEEGEVQTLSWRDASGRPQLFAGPEYGKALAACQLYFQLYSAADQRPERAVDCRPVMRIDPTPGTVRIGEVTYYTNSAEL